VIVNAPVVAAVATLSCQLVKVIVQTLPVQPASAAGIANVIVSGPEPTMLAEAIAFRKLPNPESAVVVTVKTAAKLSVAIKQAINSKNSEKRKMVCENKRTLE